MRLTCPNCAARYDVADSLIAPLGQHVQCTACHTRWFEHAASRGAAAPEADEILARLEARASRGPGPVALEPDTTRDQAEADFLWEGRAAAPRDRIGSGPHLRLVTEGSDEKDWSSESATAPVQPVEPECEPRANERPHHAEQAGGPEGGLRPADNPEIGSAPVARPGRGRLDLDHAVAQPAPPSANAVPARRRRSAILALFLTCAAVLVAAYLAADELGEAVPLLEDPLIAFTAAVENARSGLGLNGAATGE